MNERDGRPTKAEWVAVMALIADRDRDTYRVLRKRAWDALVFVPGSRKSN